MVDEHLFTAGSGGNVAVTTTPHAQTSTADQEGHFFKRLARPNSAQYFASIFDRYKYF